MVAEFAVELPAALPDRPEVLTDPRLAPRDFTVGRVEGLLAHRRSSSRLLLECGEVSGLAGEREGALYLGSCVIQNALIDRRLWRAPDLKLPADVLSRHL